MLDAGGAPIGSHPGHHNFTVGQRRGIGVSAPEALYVVATDADANTVTVGVREDAEARQVRLRDAVLHRSGEQVDAVRLRYHSATVPAALPAAGAGAHPELDVELGASLLRRLARPDGRPAGGRGDRRPRYDRRRGLTRRPPPCQTP